MDGGVDVDARDKSPEADEDIQSAAGSDSTTSEDVKSEDAKSEGVKSEDAKSEGVKSEDVKSEDAKSEGVKSEDAKSEDVKSEGAKSEDVKSEGAKPEDVKSEDAKPEDAKPEDVKSEDAKPEDAKPEEAKPEDAKPEDAKPEDAKPEDAKPEGDKSDDAESPAESEDKAGDTPPPAKRGGLSLPKSPKARWISAAAAAVVVALGVGGYVWYHNTHVPSDVAFRAYGQNVPITQLDEDVQTDQALFGIQPPTDGPGLDKFRKDFAKANAVSAVIDHVAAQRNIVIADRQASDLLARYITQVYGPGDDGHAKFVQDLANKGTSEQKVLAELKRQMTLTQLTQQVTAGAQVSDQEVQQYFDTHKAELATPERRDLHNMVVASQSEADQLVAQLKAGGNFEQLAQQNSLDTSTKDQGGELGRPVAAQELEPTYAQAAFSAPVSGIFGPVKGEHGYNVGKVVSVLPPAPAVFDQIKDPLRQELLQRKQANMWRDFLGAQIKDADVVYNPVYRPADPDALPLVGNTPAPGSQAGQPAPAGQPGPAPAPAPGK